MPLQRKITLQKDLCYFLSMICSCESVCMYMSEIPMEAEEGVGSPGPGVRGAF